MVAVTTTNADRLRAEALLEIRSLAESLLEKIEAIVPEKPTYWNGTPLDYTFPLDGTAYVWLTTKLAELIGNLTPNPDDRYDDDWDWDDEPVDEVAELLQHLARFDD